MLRANYIIPILLKHKNPLKIITFLIGTLEKSEYIIYKFSMIHYLMRGDEFEKKIEMYVIEKEYIKKE